MKIIESIKSDIYWTNYFMEENQIRTIPKIIHYCWLGPRSLPEKERHCIDSWKKYLPEYRIMLWNESTFDFSNCLFAKQAYEKGYFAFVSDYIRVAVLYKFGGIYLDTDLEVYPSLKKILDQNSSFVGFETRAQLGTAIMAFIPEHWALKQYLSHYESHPFLINGKVDVIANVQILTEILSRKGMRVDGTAQQLGDITIFPREYFYPKKIADGQFLLTSKTVAVHQCSNSWMSARQKKRGNNKFWVKACRPVLRKIKRLLTDCLGGSASRKIEIYIRNILK